MVAFKLVKIYKEMKAALDSKEQEIDDDIRKSMFNALVIFRVDDSVIAIYANSGRINLVNIDVSLSKGELKSLRQKCFGYINTWLKNKYKKVKIYTDENEDESSVSFLVNVFYQSELHKYIQENYKHFKGFKSKSERFPLGCSYMIDKRGYYISYADLDHITQLMSGTNEIYLYYTEANTREIIDRFVFTDLHRAIDKFNEITRQDLRG